MTTPPSPKPKSAEEWLSNGFPFESKDGGSITKAICDIVTIQAIQLDAAKAALTRAVEECNNTERECRHNQALHIHAELGCSKCAGKLTTLKDNLKYPDDV